MVNLYLVNILQIIMFYFHLYDLFPQNFTFLWIQLFILLIHFFDIMIIKIMIIFVYSYALACIYLKTVKERKNIKSGWEL